MKQFLVIFILLLSATFAHGQTVGLGVGSGGLAIKSSPENDWRFAGRLDLQLTSGFGLIQPSLMVARQVVNEEKAKFYLGGEIGLRLFTGFESTQVVLRTPVGVEYFPFENVPISATVEGGLNLFLERFNNALVINSLVEVTYYFGQ